MRLVPRLLRQSGTRLRIPTWAYDNRLQHPPRALFSQTPRNKFSSEAESTDSELEDPEFGNYEIILPSKPSLSPKSAFVNAVPPHIPRPPYIADPSAKSLLLSSRLELGSDDERKMREACALAKQTLDFATSLVMEGVTTAHIDDMVHQFCIFHGAYPSPLGYDGFPKSICTSVNNVVSHGIPDKRPLQDGDIVNLDITAYLDGFHGDTSRTVTVGQVDDKGLHLLKTAQEALKLGISVCRPGVPYRGIGAAIHSFIYGSATTPRPQCDDVVYTICNAFSGHGIGRAFHTRPYIVHSYNEEPGIMEPGDCFTIEPIILQTGVGERPRIWIWPDNWTASTDNGARGAVFEHTVMITNDGADVLTA